MIRQIYYRIMPDYARLRVNLMALSAWLRTRNQKPVIRFQNDRVPGQPILLVALYEKGELRPDTARMLALAKAQGAYVLATNTQRIEDDSRLHGLIDCYIERPNFGRDFGSYQTAFLHLFEQGWDRDCPRLVMLNDSIYFTTRGLASFLDQMFHAEVEVLGSTENFEHEYHLGSFCLSMAGRILAHPKFQAYWRDYKNSDIRPVVIQQGELALSRALKASASAPSQMKALYGAARYIQTLPDDPDLVDFTLQNHLVSPLKPWRRVSVERMLAQMADNHFVRTTGVARRQRRAEIEREVVRQAEKAGPGLFETEFNLPTPAGGDDTAGGRVMITSLDDIRGFVRMHMTGDDPRADQVLRDYVVGGLGEVFLHGSQIHQNAIVLLKMGLPIVKLDGLYRGIFNVVDMRKLSAQLPEGEGAELEALLLDRPYGGDNFYGWRKVAFNMGYL